ncbi:MAG: glycosyltransferase family 4 protein [Candidatus Helarchaeota archaeon]
MTDKIKLLIVVRNPVGGIRTYLKYTYGHLPSCKYHLTLLIAKENEKDSDFLRSDLKEFDSEFFEISGKYLSWRLLYFLFKILNNKHFDIIHSQGLTSCILTIIINYFFRIPHIVTLHDVFRDNQFKPPLLGFIKKRILEFFLRGVDVVQSVGEDAYNNLLDYLPGLKKVRNKLIIIKNGVSVELFQLPDKFNTKILRRELGLAKNVILFGFLGRFMPQKGFLYLVDAVQELVQNKKNFNNFKIIAVNDGDYIREYKAIIKMKRLMDYFIFYGFVPEVNNIIIQLDAIIMPSLWEAFSLLPVEALLLGCPVLASDCIGLREVVADTPALIFKHKDAHALAEAIIKFMQNIKKIKKETIDYIPLARKRFDVKNTSKQLDSLFNELVKK